MSVEVSGDVTFVNGVAAEQQTDGETQQPADEREAAIKAVREALKGEAKKAGETAAKEAKEADEQEPLRARESVERGPDGKFLPKEEKAAPKDAKDAKDGKDKPTKDKGEAEDTDESLKKVLKDRKANAYYKAKQTEELAQQAAQMRQAQQELARERQQLERDRQQLAMLRKDPVRAIRDNGWDPESFILDLAQEGTPEGQARRQQRQQAEELAEMKAWRKAQEDKVLNERRQFEQQKAVNYRQLIEKEFLRTAFESKTDQGEEKHPYLSSFYKGHEEGLLAEADVIAEKYRQLTGKEASFEDIAEYLEDRAVTWYKNRSTASFVPQAGQQIRPQVPQGRSTQGSVTGSTLSPNDSGERRSLGPSLKDLDGEERLATAREAVAAAIRLSGERT